MSIKQIYLFILKKLKALRPVHYINGPETLPPPLESEEEHRLLLEKATRFFFAPLRYTTTTRVVVFNASRPLRVRVP